VKPRAAVPGQAVSQSLRKYFAKAKDDADQMVVPQGSPIDLKHSNMVPLLTVIRVEVEEFSVGVTVMKPTHAGLLSCNRTLQGS
jgi:hypothetical protein